VSETKYTFNPACKPIIRDWLNDETTPLKFEAGLWIAELEADLAAERAAKEKAEAAAATLRDALKWFSDHAFAQEDVRQEYIGETVGWLLAQPNPGQAILDRLQKAEAAVDKLPKTADGVPVVPGRDVVVHGTPPLDVWCTVNQAGSEYVAADANGTDVAKIGECYSTREAAEAALAQQSK
jgi:hypothetical protein